MKYPLARWNYGVEEELAIIACLRRQQTTCGEQVEQFEQAFATFVGAEHAVMVNSGSSADLLLALGLGPAMSDADEVLVPAVTWPTQLSSVLVAGYKPVLVDVNPHTLQMDTDDLDRKVTGQTRAIFQVHVLGNATGPPTLPLGVPWVEDCCEALGTVVDGRCVGYHANAAAYSFFFSHALNTMEGGMVTTNNYDDARRYRLWRAHGMEPQPNNRFHFPSWGFNLRPTELQGALGLVQLQKLPAMLAARQRNYERLAALTYERYPELCYGVTVCDGCTPAWHGFPLMMRSDRDIFSVYLTEAGIENRPIITGNIARQPAVVNDKRVRTGPLPGADVIDRCGLYIGLASFDDEEGTAYVGDVVKRWVEPQ